MVSIHITRYAIQQLRKLRSAMNNRVIPDIFDQLSLGGIGGTHILRHSRCTEYCKRRLEGGGYLRLFFDDHSPSHCTVIAAVLRDDDTYDQDFDALPRNPCYAWNGETGWEWDWYINEGYLYSAQPSDQQIRDTDEAVKTDNYRPNNGNNHPDYHRVPYYSTIHQSAPGTGKTLNAAEKACELAYLGQNVVFLLPEALIDQQITEYRCIRQILQEPAGENLFIGTFHQWLAEAFPQLPFQAASPTKELAILQQIAQQHRHWQTSGRDPITYRDILLYQLYVINENCREDDVFGDNKSRIQELRDIRPQWWQEAWTGEELCRRDYTLKVLQYFQQNPPATPTPNWGTSIIIDEAQDYLVEEIEIIKHLCHHWQTEAKHPVNLWLLGDINQRIAPVDFTWGGLHLNKTRELKWDNYRTTESILTLANRFQARANASKPEGAKWLPKPTDPKFCFEKPGDTVKLLVYPDLTTAETFLDPLVAAISQQISEWQEKHSLQWRLAARARLFCSDHYHVSPDRVKFLEFMPVSQAKGREFDSCIAFCLFDLPQNGGQMEAYTKWYTQLTRARSRLLIVTTEAQLAQMGEEIFENLTITKGEKTVNAIERLNYQNPQEVTDALGWITELTSSLDTSATGRQGLREIILESALQSDPILYYDLYYVLKSYDISSQETMAIEADIVNLLFNNAELQAPLKVYFQQPEVEEVPRLQTLIYRCLGQSWQAAEIAQSLKQSDPGTYQEVMTGIQQDLHHRNLPLEADRLARFYGLETSANEFDNASWFKTSDKLIPLLKNLTEERLKIS
ncbi:hypothetical protein [Synechocystis sp. PCC 6714]|uniref:hypothetical protein n=1 Tax=Synechocystis sp. (strain PCC 6714) TaxID=1147 RepID=UPI00041B039B|nr:hypothetical protein [Synechocystis sp. PCC 6714]AIE76121.1 hypothetical protein D082_40750 [Synechocystis sp. PCC 6714]